MAQQQGLSPEIIIQVELAEHMVVKEKEVEVARGSSLEDRFSFGSVTVIEIVDVHEIHLSIPSGNSNRILTLAQINLRSMC